MDKFTGVVVKVLADGVVLNPLAAEGAASGTEHFMPVNELLGSTPEARLSALSKLTVDQHLQVASLSAVDPVQCSDAVSRPVASMWAIEQARRESERNATLEIVKAWAANGGGSATVVEVQAERGFCLVKPDGKSFVALLHVKDMSGGPANLDANNARLKNELKPGDKIPVALKEEPRIKNFRLAIRLKEKSA